MFQIMKNTAAVILAIGAAFVAMDCLLKKMKKPMMIRISLGK